ncbi:hypothetical protein XENTR_v10013094 [Xenopus tropicalis]|nr:hypothetical protein XENTR_v10013094 [Xenopus tropicalis]
MGTLLGDIFVQMIPMCDTRGSSATPPVAHEGQTHSQSQEQAPNCPLFPFPVAHKGLMHSCGAQAETIPDVGKLPLVFFIP